MIIKFKLDSGVIVNILPESLCEAILPKPIIRNSSLSLEAFGGFKLNLIGGITVNIQYKDKKQFTKFEILSNSEAKPILGLR